MDEINIKQVELMNSLGESELIPLQIYIHIFKCIYVYTYVKVSTQTFLRFTKTTFSLPPASPTHHCTEW